MARFGRSYLFKSGIHNASVINPKPNLFLPTGVKSRVAVQVALQRRQTLRNSTKLRPPTVVTTPTTTIFLPTGAHSKQVALRHSILARRMFDPSTDVWNAIIVNRPAPFLPTLKPKLARNDQRIIRAFKYRAGIKQPRITALPTIFLPTGPHAMKVALRRRPQPALSTRLHNGIVIVAVPPTGNNPGFFLLFPAAA